MATPATSGESLYDGESVADSDRSGPETALLTGKSFLLGHQSINRKLFKVEPKKETLKIGAAISPTLNNLSDSRLAFKVILPTYPYLTIYPSQGFLAPRKKVILNVTHDKMDGKKDSEIKAIISMLPPIQIVGFEVSNSPKTDNIDELLIFENGVTTLTVWTELLLTAVINPNSNPAPVLVAPNAPELKQTPQTFIFLIFPYFLWQWFLHYYFPEYLVPKIDADDFFGEGSLRADNEIIRDFEIFVDPKSVMEFKNGIKNGIDRASKSLENINFELGFNVEYLKSLNKSFEDFDWKQHERFLNTFKHYKTEIEGIDLHFLRHDFPLKKGQQKVPILLIHGFGSSFWDFYKIIPILANPSRFGYDFGSEGNQIVFDVIVPSLPGFGFSQAPTKPGLGSIQAGRILGKLMDRLGHEKYFIHGSSALGSQIATNLALIRPKNVRGIHLANPFMDFETNTVAKIKWFASKILKQDISDLKVPKNVDIFERPDSYGNTILLIRNT
uniref:Epoxide hydrolase N-terminal domain-containing protein n=1 Tax=Panagrolaimus superbus TaxID=310955 RepID=A0A914ZB86_9BILA